jgi:RNA polymerase sigma factor (sigma-70 family)
MVALVLGTALSAFGASAAAAKELSPDTARAVSDISRYCTACWRNARLLPDCWPDCTQEVFCRLLERLDPDAWGLALADDGLERRELVRAIDAVKKRLRRARRWAPQSVALAADTRAAADRCRADERDAVRLAAETLLSARQRRILQLSFDGWSVHEIAGELRLPAERISDEKYKAVQKLRAHFAAA